MAWNVTSEPLEPEARVAKKRGLILSGAALGMEEVRGEGPKAIQTLARISDCAISFSESCVREDREYPSPSSPTGVTDYN